MEIEIKRNGTPEEIKNILSMFCKKFSEEKKKRQTKYLGILTLKEDAVVLQRRWRDEF